ncbi:soluble lytic murein transglycosylase-like protein [Novosphingobium sp. PhB165]|uniref:lytic transglycosylase domain-containing protein n=1 Tax=Novosphingobium sp. PhB165 TaxID=2485105 RepID=UPI0010D84740|nr:lytic transglycosylase domain-containing protein [Novosphingobium sp. PhB165]TCM12985.1 soluble lytic murein transglycosylase-like protein [Novosphingobium sp. PhB165]
MAAVTAVSQGKRSGALWRRFRIRFRFGIVVAAYVMQAAVPTIGLCTAAPAQAGESDEVGLWHAEIAEASERFGVPAVWIERVMRAESRGHTSIGGRPIVSPAGAMGLMQLMPATWEELRAKLGLGTDPHMPRDNILAGTAYLREMFDRFGYPGLFAAYNAGPARYAASIGEGRPLPPETRAYLASVAGYGAPAGTAFAGGVPASSHAPHAGTGGPSIFIGLTSAPLPQEASDQNSPDSSQAPARIDPIFAIRAAR